MDQKKPQQRSGLPAGGQTPFLGLQDSLTNLARVGDPKIRIAFLVVMLVFIGGAILWLRGIQKGAKGPATPFRPSVEIPATPVEEIGLPPLDMRHATSVADATEEERRRWENETISYLLLEARTSATVPNYRRGLFPLDAANAATISAESAPWRLRFFRFRGRLEYLREENYEEVYGPVESHETGLIQRGRILLAGTENARVSFVSVRPLVWRDSNSPEPYPEVQPIVDGWVRGRGIFVKNYVEEDPGGKAVPSFLFVATQIDRDYEPVEVRTLADIPFDVIRDAQHLANDPKTKPLLFRLFPIPLFRLLQYASKRTGPEGAELRRKETPKSLRWIEEYEELIAHPEKHRGEYLAGLGALAVEPALLGEEEWQPEFANDAGVESYLSGWIYTDSMQLVQFAAPASLAQDLRSGSRIHFEGYFYKNQAYRAQNRTERMAPFLVLTNLGPLPLPARDVKWDMIFGASLFVVIGVLVFLVIRKDRTKENYRAERRKRRQAREAARG